MKLTEHFTKEELIYSDTAKRLNINNEPSEVQLKTLIHTCQYFLEPLRKLLNDNFKSYKGLNVKQVIIKITSGFRCNKLNSKIGSKSTSQHIKGEAVDFDVILILEDGSRKTLSYLETYYFIKKQVMLNKLSVDQLICESSNGVYWVHASYKAAGSTVNRKQFMLYENGTYMIDKV